MSQNFLREDYQKFLEKLSEIIIDKVADRSINKYEFITGLLTITQHTISTVVQNCEEENKPIMRDIIIKTVVPAALEPPHPSYILQKIKKAAPQNEPQPL